MAVELNSHVRLFSVFHLLTRAWLGVPSQEQPSEGPPEVDGAVIIASLGY